jgi:hypothetical protein
MEYISDRKKEYPFLGLQDLMIELSRFKDLADSELEGLHTNLDPLVSARLHLDKGLINGIKDYEQFLKSCSSEIAEIMEHKETGLIESDIKRLKKIADNAKLINGIITDI